MSHVLYNTLHPELTPMALPKPFSVRHSYAGTKEITVREDAPDGLRFFVVETARQLGWSPSALRALICLVLRVKPDKRIPQHLGRSDGPGHPSASAKRLPRIVWFETQLAGEARPYGIGAKIRHGRDI
jgi:hypothetical protein